MTADKFPSLADDDRTSLTLLAKVRDLTDQKAWGRFFARYQPIVVGWCLRQGLQRADADEVAAMVLEKLVRTMPQFAYDPAQSFRAWLSTVVKRAIIDFRRRTAASGGRGTGDSDQLDRLAKLVAERDFESSVAELTADLHRPLKKDLDLSRAICGRVQSRVARQVWQAFWLTAVENRTGLEAAGQLGLKAATVFVYKARVIKMLREEAAAVGESSS